MSDSKTLMITGASSDIGMSLIEKVHNHYSMIIAQYSHMNEKLQKLKEELGEKMWLLQSDFSNEQSVCNMVETLKNKDITVDHFVHLASEKARVVPFRKTEWNDVESGINISVRSVYMILQYLLHKMVKQKFGKVIFMLTSYVINDPSRNVSPYVISKYSLLGLLKSLEVEYTERGIIFNAISPDMIDTKFLTELPELMLTQSRKSSYSERNLQIEEVVPVLEFLLSDAGNAVKGQNIPILNP